MANTETKLHEIIEVHEVPYFRKMKVESGWLYNFYDVKTDNYSKEWIFVPVLITEVKTEK